MRVVRRSPMLPLVLAAIALMAGVALFAGGGPGRRQPDNPVATWQVVTATANDVATRTPTPATTRVAGPLPRDVEESARAVAAVATVSPAVVTVVNLTTAQKSESNGEAFTGVGSGVVVDAVGHVVTSLRVAGEFGDLLVVLADGRMVAADRVLVDRDAAMVILQLAEPTADYATLATDAPAPGEVVLAIGMPLQVLPYSVSRGVIQAVGVDVDATVLFPAGTGLIQHDAAVNIAGDGGALVDLDGRLVGVTVIALTADPSGEPVYGMAFAVPAARIARELAALR
jgi:serine protease DegS